MRVLDLFSGRGGFCKPWADNGHEVVTLDNDTDGTFSSTHTTNISNFSPLDHYPVGHFDVILAGVPCTEYARWGMRGVNRTLQSMDPETIRPKNELLNEFIRIRDELKPTYWVVENVRSSIPFISEHLGRPSVRIGMRWFWSNTTGFETFFGPTEMKLIQLAYIPKTHRHRMLDKKTGKYRWVGRSRRGVARKLSTIEYSISEAWVCFLTKDMVSWRRRASERILEIRRSRGDYNRKAKESKLILP